MTTVTEHKENLARELVKLKSEDQLKFAAWCCLALTGESSIFDFLSRYSNLLAPELHTHILDGLNSVWAGNESDSDLSELRIREWDMDDISMDDDADAQGAADLLSAISFLTAWVRSHSVIELVSCAEQVINRVDYLEGFEILPAGIKNPVESEIRAQTKFIDDLESGVVTDDDKLKYHEWLFPKS
ncbi:hypothetical protein [Burkholderia sp. Ac-20353]|uniref:hypothetical protein n=1 Tax=Burkholderia sp. Ac-20353 TaxID=2703894 RepID=UPI00197B589C|nr:hypothetical protein [Burkholderia sp. Ac-20353]MBN3787291.1 hypothetical protein [Burkholderia sp. Ac-20353]